MAGGPGKGKTRCDAESLPLPATNCPRHAEPSGCARYVGNRSSRSTGNACAACVSARDCGALTVSETMTSAERTQLMTLIRARARAAKAQTDQRAAELRADFEEQLDRHYSYDEEGVWQEAYCTARKAIEEGNAAIKQRCSELGIPAQFAPALGF